MKNLKRKLTIASLLLCSSALIGGCAAAGGNGVMMAAADEAVTTLEGFKVKSAALRLPDEEYGQGIRFTVGLGNVELAKGAKAGALLIPTSSLGGAELKVGLDNKDLRVIEKLDWRGFADKTREAYIHLYDIPKTDYTTDITIRAYIDHDANPETEVIYTDVASTSVAKAAEWLYGNDDELSGDELANLQASYLTYDVIYHNGEEETKTTGIYNKTIAAPETPVKVGYDFGGWWNKAGTHEWNFESTVISGTQTNLYAKWTPATNIAYTVKVYQTTNGGAQEEITANISGFQASRTGTTGEALDITAEANAIVETLGAGYSLVEAESVLTGEVAADGTTELKIVVNLNEITANRTGADKDTVLFFDRELGATQQATSASEVNYAYTTEMAYGNESGSLKLSAIPYASGSKFFYYDIAGMEFEEGDYVVFYVYSTNSRRVYFCANSEYKTTGQELMSNAWTKVVMPASVFAAQNRLRIYQVSYNESAQQGTFDMYISKVVRYNESEVVALANKGADDTWTLGGTTFKGAPSVVNGTISQEGVYAASEYKKAYMIDGELVVTISDHNDPRIIMYPETTIEMGAKTDVYVTVVMYDYDLEKKIDGYLLGSATNQLKFVSVESVGNGYSKVTLKCTTGSSECNATSIRIDTEDVKTNAKVVQLRIKDVNVYVGDEYFTALRTGKDADTVLFLDREIGTKQVMINESGVTYTSAYTTDMKYGNESGSLKVQNIPYGSPATAYVHYYYKDMQFNEGDYVVFNVYSEATRSVFFAVNYYYATTGHELMPGDWTKVIIPAEIFKQFNWMMINQYTYNSATQSGTFNLYFSKAVRYSASEVVELKNATATDTWKIGETTFVGAPGIKNGGENASGVLTAKSHKEARLVDGELVITFARSDDPQIRMTLAESMEIAANTEVYITLVMKDYTRKNLLNGYLNSSGSTPLSYVSKEDVGNGYVKVTLKCAAKSEAYTLSSVRLDTEVNDKGDYAGTVTQLCIKDIAISTKEA